MTEREVVGKYLTEQEIDRAVWLYHQQPPTKAGFNNWQRRCQDEIIMPNIARIMTARRAESDKGDDDTFMSWLLMMLHCVADNEPVNTTPP